MLFGTTGTARALGPAGASPIAVGALRIELGAAALLAIAMVGGRGGLLVRCWEPEVRWATLVGALAVAAYQGSFFAAVKLSGVALGTLVAIGAAPVLAGLFDLVLGERPSRRWAVATALAVLGCAVLLLPGSQPGAGSLGVMLAVAAGAAYAALAVASRRLLLRVGSPDAVVAVVFLGGALLLLPVLAVQDLRWLATGRGLATVAWLGLPATAFAYWFFARGLARLPAATATTLDLAEPLTASILGVALLGERPGLTTLAGASLVAAGLLLLSLPGRTRD